MASNHGIPGPAIAGDVERHLRLPHQGSRQENSELSEERQLGYIPDRVVRRVGPKWDVEPEDRTDDHKCLVWDAW